MRMRPSRTTLAIAYAALIAVGHGVAADTLAVSTGAGTGEAVPPSHAPSDSGPAWSILVAPDTAAARMAEVAAPPETLLEVGARVPVLLDGREIFAVRVARDGVTPAARATAIRARLDAAVIDVATSADSVFLRRTPEGVAVSLGDHFLWMIAPGDVEGLSVSELAAMMNGLPMRLSQGIRRERSGRTPMGILISVLIAVGITILAWILARLLRGAGRRWRDYLARTLPQYLHGIRIGTFDVLSGAQLVGVVGGILGRAGLVGGLVLLYGYLAAVFSLFPRSRGWSRQLLDFAGHQLTAAALAVGGAIPQILIIASVFILFWWLTHLSDRFFEAIDAKTVTVDWMHPELAKPTQRLVGILLWITAAAIAYPYIPGSQSKAVQGISILLGVMVSIGSSGIVGNAIAGIVLTYTRSFSKGERVRIGDHVGDIVSLGFFATKLRSPRNEEITLPNGLIAAQPIVNYTRLAAEAGLMLHTQVTIGYDADWRVVHGLLIEAAGRVEGIEPEPAPFVLQRSLNDYHISYEICCVTKRSHQQLRLYSRLHEEIQDAFARAGLEILSPAFNALRDANATVLPAEPKGPRPAAGGFRIRPPS